MFTFGDIRNIAVQIEKNGETTYSLAAKLATDPKVVETLEWMAQQEQSHGKWLSNLQSGRDLSEEQRELESMGKALLQDMVRGNDFLLDPEELQGADSMQEVIEKSIGFEQDTIVFYDFLLGFLDDEETARQLQEIIEEERGHIRKLEELDLLCSDSCDGRS